MTSKRRFLPPPPQDLRRRRDALLALVAQPTRINREELRDVVRLPIERATLSWPDAHLEIRAGTVVCHAVSPSQTLTCVLGTLAPEELPHCLWCGRSARMLRQSGTGWVCPDC